MEILLDVSRSPEGRLVGTAASARRRHLEFSGTLELLARVEELCRDQGSDTVPPDQDQEPESE